MGKTIQLSVLLAAGAMTTMAGGVVAPVLPDIIRQLQIEPTLAGNLVSAHCLTIALFSPLLGVVADRVGPLRVLVPSLVAYGLVGVAGASMESFWPLLATRALLGAAAGGIAAASLGMLGNLYEGTERSQALGYATSTLTVAGIAFPLLGGLLGSLGWRYAFYLYGVAIPLALVAVSVLRNGQSARSPKTPATPKGMGATLSDPPVLQILIALALASVSMYAVVIYAPLYLEAMIGAGPEINGIVLAARAIGAAVVSALAARRLAQKIGTSKAIALGFGLMALTLVTIPFLSTLAGILPAAIAFGGGFGLVLPNLYSILADLSPPDQRATVLAAGTGTSFLGQFLSPILLGPTLALGGLEGVFYGAGAIAAIAGISCQLLIRPVPKPR